MIFELVPMVATPYWLVASSYEGRGLPSALGLLCGTKVLKCVCVCVCLPACLCCSLTLSEKPFSVPAGPMCPLLSATKS